LNFVNFKTGKNDSSIFIKTDCTQNSPEFRDSNFIDNNFNLHFTK